jgi:hypothetical protein
MNESRLQTLVPTSACLTTPHPGQKTPTTAARRAGHGHNPPASLALLSNPLRARSLWSALEMHPNSCLLVYGICP